jgi:uncharacterized phage protein (TIGR02216 family)
LNAADAVERVADASPFPWDAVMRISLLHLRLSPDQFWRMTPRELAMILATRRTTQAPDRAALDDLMRSFPDREQFP